MADISSITLPNGDSYDLKDSTARSSIPSTYAGSSSAGGPATVTNGIHYGTVSSSSTSTAYTASIPGITEYYDGLTVMLKNGVVTSAANFVLDINNIGGKPVYSNMAAATRETTIFNANYTLMFVYDSTRVTGGCWINYRGYYSDSNSTGYQLRTNSTVLKTADKSRYYRLFFTSADGTHWVPANTGTDNSATSVKTVNQRPIDPFGRIVYYSTTTNMAAEADVGATYCWDQYAFALGYSFNTTGEALTLTTKTPVYIKCTPQSNGSAIIDSTTPYVQTLPSTEDGKIYIYLGVAYSATNVELTVNHPVYYYANGSIRPWTNQNGSGTVTSVNGQSGVVVLDADDVGALPDSTAIPTKTSDLTNDSGFITGITSSDVTNALGYTPPQQDTTYESKAAASGGTAVSLVTTGEKYTWNNKGTYSKPSGGIPDSDIASAATWNAKGNGTITGINMNGASKGTSGVVDLGTVITAHQDISGKADKSSTVSNVAYDSTNKKITKTINGTTSDVVTAATLKTAMSLAKGDVGLGNVDNVKQYSASNPPPYPVTSVNGNTGAVTISIPESYWQYNSTNDSIDLVFPS